MHENQYIIRYGKDSNDRKRQREDRTTAMYGFQSLGACQKFLKTAHLSLVGGIIV